MAKRNGVLDTNVLLDWLLDRDSKRSAKIKRLFEVETQFLLPDLVVAELVYSLQKYYQLSRSEVAQNLSVVFSRSQFICNRSVMLRVLATYVSQPSLSFVDCYLLEFQESDQAAQLWTFDRKLVKHSGGRAKLLK